MSEKFYLQALGMCNALGNSLSDIAPRLFDGNSSGLLCEENWLPSRPARVGRVCGELPDIPPTLSEYACLVTRLLLLALSQIREEVDAAIGLYGRERVAIVLGTSTSGIAGGEAAITEHCANRPIPAAYHYTQQELGMPAFFLARYLDVTGPAYCVSTACTSSAKAFVSARSLLRQNFCDAVIVGGADTLCKLTISGFSALELTTVETCNPMSRNRKGINIGEGAALFLMTRETGDIELLGAGESSDAYHMSTPHPDGLGAELAMRAALEDAGLQASDVDYLNMHATATSKNDAMESLAISRVFPCGVPASGTKPLTGHLLGASGATELGFCWIALRDGRMPVHPWDGERDPELPALNFVRQGERFSRSASRVCMSTSFAFGGNNACLLIGDKR